MFCSRMCACRCICIRYNTKFVYESNYKIMPKKNRQSKAPVPIYKNILTLDNKEHADVIKGFCEMFPSVETDVINLIVDESENNVEQALETLISLSNSDKTSVIEDEAKTPVEELQKNEKINFSNISKIFQESPCTTEPDSTEISQASTTCLTNLNSEGISHPLENLKSIKPKFIVPSVPMHGSPSPHKSSDLDGNKCFWNVPDSKCFSTHFLDYYDTADCFIKKTIEKIQKSCRVLIILRGLPGSGKSSLALKLKFSGEIFSTDDFFLKNGKYLFDFAMLSEAHVWNKIRTKKALEKGITPIIIDNTNVEAWQIKPYILMGKTYNYEIVILEPNTPWKFKVKELASRNKHGVSEAKIAKMKAKYEKNITVESILGIRRFSNEKSKSIDGYEDSENKDVTAANVNCKIFEENDISLKAVIHRESSFEGKCSFNNSSMDHNSSTEKYVDNQPITVHNLDELRTLTRNDSEDSYSSVNGSLQETVGWEAITEPDDDFRWSTLNEELKYSAKSSSSDNLSMNESVDPLSSQDNVCSTNSSIENLTSSGDDSSVELDRLKSAFKSDQTNFNISSSNSRSIRDILSPEIFFDNKSVITKEGKLSLSEINIDNEEGFNWLDDSTEGVDHSLVTADDTTLRNSMKHLTVSDETVGNNEDLIFSPKPCRNNNTHLLISEKDNFTDLFQQNSLECGSEQWNTPDNKIDSFVENHSEVVISSAPKPQRKTFESKYYKLKSKSNHPNSKSILNISIDSDWKFPEFVLNDTTHTHHSSLNIGRKLLSFKMSAYSQTETRDFDLMHQISVGNSTVDSCNYRIIDAKYCNDIYISDFNSESFPSSLEITTYPEIASFDKSTSTDDLVDNVEISQKLSYLQQCFPDISKEDLLYLLEICYNNERWICNLLLDWGYKYNVPEKNFGNNSEKKLDDEENCCKYKNIFSRPRKKILPTKEKSSSYSSSDTDDQSTSSSNDIENKLNKVECKSKKKPNKTLTLTLNPAFAHQLEKHFGPVANSASLHVDIDLKLAEMLHAKWKSTVIDSKNDKTGKKHINKRKYTPPKCTKDSSFSEIMDRELALDLHKQEKLKQDESFGTKLIRQELYNKFPGVDFTVLDEIFESNNCSLKESLLALGEVDEEPTKDIPKENKVKKIDNKDFQNKLKILQEFESGDWSEWVYTNDSEKDSSTHLANSAILHEAAELRSEAAKQYQLRIEYIKKAQNAFNRGMQDVALYYNEQGREYAEMSKRANEKAAALVVKSNNSAMKFNCLDLHNLHTKEAISILEKYLKDTKAQMKRNNIKTPCVISVITGKGLHSVRGPKIPSAVRNFLTKKGYSYSFIYEGKLDVTVLPE